MLSASVPGGMDVVCTVLKRWGSGRFDLPRILAPAIRYAEEETLVAATAATSWAEHRDLRVALRVEHARLPAWRSSLPAGRVWFSLPEYAASLRGSEILKGGSGLCFDTKPPGTTSISSSNELEKRYESTSHTHQRSRCSRLRYG
jgi:gamma-glutamyltranspeptidase